MSRLSPAKLHALGLADITQGIRLVKRGEQMVRNAAKAGFQVARKARTETEQAQDFTRVVEGQPRRIESTGSTAATVGGE